MKPSIFCFLSALLFLSSAMAQTASIENQTLQESRALHLLQQRTHDVHLASLRKDPIYQESLGACQRGELKSFISVAWSGAQDMASAAQIIFLDVSGIVRLYKNSLIGSKLAHMISSEAFTLALRDCDPTLVKSKRVVMAYFFSDWLGKSIVIVAGGYALSRGLLVGVYKLITKTFGKLHPALKIGVVGSGILYSFSQIYQYGKQWGSFQKGRNENTAGYDAAIELQDTQRLIFLNRVLEVSEFRRDSLLQELKTRSPNDTSYARLQEELIYRNVTIQELKKRTHSKQ